MYQMLRELCDGQSQIQQWLNAVEDRSSRSQTHGTPTELEQAPANDYPVRGSTQSGEPPQGRSLPQQNREGAEWPHMNLFGQCNDCLAPGGRPHDSNARHSSLETGARHLSYDAELTAWLEEINALEKGVEKCNKMNHGYWKENDNLLTQMVNIGKQALLAKCHNAPGGHRANIMASDIYNLQMCVAQHLTTKPTEGMDSSPPTEPDNLDECQNNSAPPQGNITH